MEIEKILIPLASLIVGALSGYFFSIKLEFKKRFIEERTKAYVDYARVVGKVKFMERSEWLANLIDVKARICIYGSPDVIKALGNFEHTSLILDNEPTITAFLNIIEKMRKGTTRSAEMHHIKDVLLGASKHE